MSIRSRVRWSKLAALLLAVAGVSALSGCGKEAAKPAPAAAPARDASQVKVDAELLKRIQVAPVVPVEIQEYFRVAGSVQGASGPRSPDASPMPRGRSA